MTQEIVLKYTCRELDIVAISKIPPVVYDLPEGMTRDKIQFNKNVGHWRLDWVATKGRNDRGKLLLFPNNSVARTLLYQRLLNHYIESDFHEIEARILANVDIPEYWNKNVMRLLRFITSGKIRITNDPSDYSRIDELVEEYGVSRSLTSKLVNISQVIEKETMDRYGVKL